jgi:hypothetical protein
MKLTPQQALEEARKRYTGGTEYKSAVTDCRYIIGKNPSFEIYEPKSGHFMIFEDSNSAAVYTSRTDQWAEIISTPKSLEDRLVDGYGFEKTVIGYGPSFHLKLNELKVSFHYIDNELKCVNLFIGSQFIHTNPNNLEDFIKAYLRLF